ncbi:hypothetical protein [Serratia marcescens]|uniref:hypothetical protein n=1 Tax=Serratia marcescens TaxID=615 RepID=UPI00187E03DF|nr:hypothetical protein [Serratia marcescens]MBE8812225.1 hypothetical protein [Serratia marcescens]
MDTLEVVSLLNNSLKPISVNLNSEKGWLDYLSVLAPMVIGVVALIITAISNYMTLKSQKVNSTRIAKVEIATKLKYEWLSNVRTISAKLAGELDLIAHLSVRMSNVEIQYEHFKSDLKSDLKSDAGELIQRRAGLYEDLAERKRVSSVMCYEILTYLNESKHKSIFETIGELSVILRSEGRVRDHHGFSNTLGKFIQQIHSLLDDEWKELLKYPLRD